MLDEKHDSLRLFIGFVLGGLSAVTLTQWVMISTLIYTIMQAALLIPRYITLFKNWKRKRSNDN